MFQYEDSRPLRQWQRRAYEKFLLSSEPNFLAVATPGAGKTRFALYVASEMLRLGEIARIIIVCPSIHLKKQWAIAAHEAGIPLTPNFSNGDGSFASDYLGPIATYGQVASSPEIFRHQCRVPTLAILDEIHHADDEKPWGNSLQKAFEPAVRRLLLSGTPFRTRGPISLVRYDDRGVSVADYTYSYGEAIGDDVCRPVFFPSYEGDMKWYSRGKAFEHTFRDPIPDDRAAQRLRTALDPSGEWIRQVLHDANTKLSFVREGHPDAGGLVVAMDCEHANRISFMLRDILGELPTVVTCDDPDSSRRIDEYAASSKRWIVAVRMISEGVDIARLRVGVYATNILTEMYFRQVVGRFVRMMPGIDDQAAFLYIPRDETLVGYAQRIKEERAHQLELEVRDAVRDTSEGDKPACDDKLLSLFLAVSAKGHADDVFSDGEVITQAEIREADELKREVGLPASYDSASLVKLIRRVRGTATLRITDVSRSSATPATEPVFAQKERLRKVIRKCVTQLVNMSDGTLDYQRVFARLIDRDGVDQKTATLDQLKARLAFLEEWIRSYPDVR